MIASNAPTGALTWAYSLERVTRIELALSAWESRCRAVPTCATWVVRVPG